ncbi:rRNA maturation RNase YbeY [Rariglobus hedericola]|uniref:Endoribonuclease YbeY n=1 Tax=Rariglobus hedericola TaxID=2597822 RepID=A0A556QQI2_9BACT|nr:rRNA maturation RNase YbeY [Rariglobus hedericola]TSJ78883.1 rRNA maturation RNase YbeY [Rariglobus hedericola]
MPRSLDIHNAHPRLRIDKKAISRVITILDEHRAKFLGGCPDGELSLAFLTDAKLAKLHDDFLDDPTTTDVITFEGEPGFGVAGEICVSADTAGTYSKTNDRDFSEELTLYIVHGWLHLAGYDDLEPAKKRKMRAAEARAMKLLHAAKSVPDFTLKR